MAARDAVKRVPTITRNHCPTSAKCALMAVAGKVSGCGWASRMVIVRQPRWLLAFV